MSQHQQAFLADSASQIDRVAQQVLTRLLQGTESASHETPSNHNSEKSAPNFSSLDAIVGVLYQASISHDRGELAKVMRDLVDANMGTQTLLCDVVPQVALQLGKAWESDSLSFGAVTIGCARLQAMILRLDENASAARLDLTRIPQARALDCLVIVPENAQHTLGAIVLAKQLRRGGHRVRLNLAWTPEAQSKLVQSHLFDAIMISASRTESPEELRALVAASRAKGAKSKVFVGGGILEQHRDLAVKTGADYARNDFQSALDLCLGRTSGLKEP